MKNMTATGYTFGTINTLYYTWNKSKKIEPVVKWLSRRRAVCQKICLQIKQPFTGQLALNKASSPMMDYSTHKYTHQPIHFFQSFKEPAKRQMINAQQTNNFIFFKK